MEHSDEVGFNVGWDHAEHGVQMPEEIMSGTLADGYRAGMDRRGRARAKDADRFVRKWLLLRRNAWRRGRIFDPEVTPSYLRAIDVRHCPITRELLTHGSCAETDWSVDRLNNDGGYAVGNLVVMSVRANKVKDGLTTSDIVDRAAEYDGGSHLFFLNSAPIEGLSAEETMRLYTITMMPSAGSVMLPARVFTPPMLPCQAVYVLQCNLSALSIIATIDAKTKVMLQRIDPGMSGLSRVTRRMMASGRPKFAARYQSVSDAKLLTVDDIIWCAEDTWGPDTGVYNEFHNWIWKTPAERITYIQGQVSALAAARGLSSRAEWQSVDQAAMARRMGSETRGYVTGR